MRSIKIFLIAFLVLTVLTRAQVSWKVDRVHSQMEFGLKFMMINDFEGRFETFDGKINSNSESDFSNANVSFMIDTRTIETGDVDRDKHLKNKMYFDSDKYPRITFSSTSFKPGKVKGTYDLEGNLTIKGNTQKVKLQAIGAAKPVVNHYSGKTMYAFNISGKIRRGDFGVGPYELMNEGGFVLGEEVDLNCNLMLVKADKVIPTSANKVYVDAKKLDSYVGQYQVTSNIILSVAREGDHLEAAASGGQNKNDIFPETETKFFWEFADMKIEFLKNDSGRVSNFVLYKDGMKTAEGKKISNEVRPTNTTDQGSGQPYDLGTREGLKMQAWEELENKNYGKASALFGDAIKMDGNDISLQLGLAHTHLFFGNTPKAMEIYKANVGKKNPAGKTFENIIQEDFTYFKSRKFPAAPMDKAFAELKLQPNSTYGSIK